MSDHVIAIDVETANRHRSSICQIGLVAFTREGAGWEWSSLVNPQCDFDSNNVRIHGITSAMVASAPTWPDVMKAVYDSIRGQFLVSHSPFDCEAIHQTCARYKIAPPDCAWIDSQAMAKTCWPNLPRYDLRSLCEIFGIALQHHDALGDARACGSITSQAITESRLSIDQWIARTSAPRPTLTEVALPRRYSEKIEAMGDPNGPLAGQVWVCTGDFVCGEAELVRLATSLGCDVKERFGKKATILVVGQRNPDQFSGKEKSKKLIDAEAALAAGRKVHILTEREFLELARYYLGGTTVLSQATQ